MTRYIAILAFALAAAVAAAEEAASAGAASATNAATATPAVATAIDPEAVAVSSAVADTPATESVPQDAVEVDVTAVAVAKAQEEARLEAAAKERAEAEEKAEAALDRRRISTRVFRLVHANADEVAERFNATWSGDFGATWKVSKIASSFPEANAVMVTAPNRILEACEAVIEEIDREARQVYIEARFVELSNTASHKLGIDWSMLGGMSGRVGLGGGIQKTWLGRGVNDFTRQITSKTESDTYKLSGGAGSDGGVSYFNGTLDFDQMYLTLRALEQSEDARVFSNPKIIVSSGRKATVDMTTKYPNVTVSAKRTLNGNSESLDLAMNMSAIPGEDKFMFAKEAFFSWGISLDVTPRIGTNGLINVTIVPTISDLDTTQGVGGFVTAESDSSGEVEYSSKYPIIKMQRLITEFNMASGATAVIGGLSRTVETQHDSGIPWLRTWPWIGPRLFGSKVREKEQREIIVFVTVGFVDPKRIAGDAGLPKNAVLGRQYVHEQKLEPGDRPEKNMEGLESLDMRPLEEQAKDPLKQKPEKPSFSFGDYMPFRKDPNYRANEREDKQI